MDDIIVGTEALAAGFVTRQMLRTKYVKLEAADGARAAWLWSRRTATLVGHSAGRDAWRSLAAR